MIILNVSREACFLVIFAFGAAVFLAASGQCERLPCLDTYRDEDTAHNGQCNCSVGCANEEIFLGNGHATNLFNALYKKPASPSNACAAVNGRKSNLLNAQNCFYTKAVAPWWSVDMLRPYTITQVFFVPAEVVDNKEETWRNMVGVTVLVDAHTCAKWNHSNNAIFNRDLTNIVMAVECTKPRKGRVVRFQKDLNPTGTNAFLQICEVQTYVCQPGHYLTSANKKISFRSGSFEKNVTALPTCGPCPPERDCKFECDNHFGCVPDRGFPYNLAIKAKDYTVSSTKYGLPSNAADGVKYIGHDLFCWCSTQSSIRQFWTVTLNAHSSINAVVITGREDANKINMIYIVDASGSVSAGEMEDQKNLLRTITRSDLGRSGRMRVGIISYDDAPIAVLTIANNDEATIIAGINSIQGGGRTSTGAAFAMAAAMFRTDANTNATKIILLLTDGKPTDMTNSLNQGQELLQMGVVMHAVFINTDASWICDAVNKEAYWSKVISPPLDDHLWCVTEFSHLRDLPDKIASALNTDSVNFRVQVHKTSSETSVFDICHEGRLQFNSTSAKLPCAQCTDWEKTPAGCPLGLSVTVLINNDNVSLELCEVEVYGHPVQEFVVPEYIDATVHSTARVSYGCANATCGYSLCSYSSVCQNNTNECQFDVGTFCVADANCASRHCQGANQQEQCVATKRPGEPCAASDRCVLDRAGDGSCLTRNGQLTCLINPGGRCNPSTSFCLDTLGCVGSPKIDYRCKIPKGGDCSGQKQPHCNPVAMLECNSQHTCSLAPGAPCGRVDATECGEKAICDTDNVCRLKENSECTNYKKWWCRLTTSCSPSTGTCVPPSEMPKPGAGQPCDGGQCAPGYACGVVSNLCESEAGNWCYQAAAVCGRGSVCDTYTKKCRLDVNRNCNSSVIGTCKDGTVCDIYPKKCKIPVGLHVNHVIPDQCFHDNQCVFGAVCDTDSNTCICVRGGSGVDGFCHAENGELGSNCTSPNNCATSNTICQDDGNGVSRCVCAPGFEGDYATGTCKIAVGWNCMSNTECVSGSVCEGGICKLDVGELCIDYVSVVREPCKTPTTCNNTLGVCSINVVSTTTEASTTTTTTTSATTPSTTSATTPSTTSATTPSTTTTSATTATGARSLELGANCTISDSAQKCTANHSACLDVGNGVSRCVCTAGFQADSATRTCKIAVGGNCTADEECVSGSVCDGGTCKIAVGGNCSTSNTQCVSRSVCDGGTCKIDFGGNCSTSNKQCVSRSVCDGGTCKIAAGWNCPSNKQCASGSVCDGGTCKIAVGWNCTSNTECVSGSVCDGGTCNYPKSGTLGANCTVDDNAIECTANHTECQDVGDGVSQCVCTAGFQADYTKGTCKEKFLTEASVQQSDGMSTNILLLIIGAVAAVGCTLGAAILAKRRKDDKDKRKQMALAGAAGSPEALGAGAAGGPEALEAGVPGGDGSPSVASPDAQPTETPEDDASASSGGSEASEASEDESIRSEVDEGDSSAPLSEVISSNVALM